MKVQILGTQCGDWEGLFIDGNCITQGHEIHRDELLDTGVQYGFNSSDIEYEETNDEGEAYMEAAGEFPNALLDFVGKY